MLTCVLIFHYGNFTYFSTLKYNEFKEKFQVTKVAIEMLGRRGGDGGGTVLMVTVHGVLNSEGGHGLADVNEDG